jgi:hypothetical protein
LLSDISRVINQYDSENANPTSTVTAFPVIVFKREKYIEDSGNIFGYEGDFDGLMTRILLVVLGQTVEVLDSTSTVTAFPVIVFKREKYIEDSGNIFGYEVGFDGLMTRILLFILGQTVKPGNDLEANSNRPSEQPVFWTSFANSFEVFLEGSNRSEVFQLASIDDYFGN